MKNRGSLMATGFVNYMEWYAGVWAQSRIKSIAMMVKRKIEMSPQITYPRNDRLRQTQTYGLIRLLNLSTKRVHQLHKHITYVHRKDNGRHGRSWGPLVVVPADSALSELER